MPAPHHPIFYRPDALLDAQPCHSTEGNNCTTGNPDVKILLVEPFHHVIDNKDLVVDLLYINAHINLL